MGDMIDRDAVQSAVRAYLALEDSEIALEVEQIIAALPAAPAEDVRAGALEGALQALMATSKHEIDRLTLCLRRIADMHPDTVEKGPRAYARAALIPGAKP